MIQSLPRVALKIVVHADIGHGRGQRAGVIPHFVRRGIFPASVGQAQSSSALLERFHIRIAKQGFAHGQDRIQNIEAAGAVLHERHASGLEQQGFHPAGREFLRVRQRIDPDGKLDEAGQFPLAATVGGGMLQRLHGFSGGKAQRPGGTGRLPVFRPGKEEFHGIQIPALVQQKAVFQRAFGAVLSRCDFRQAACVRLRRDAPRPPLAPDSQPVPLKVKQGLFRFGQGQAAEEGRLRGGIGACRSHGAQEKNARSKGRISCIPQHGCSPVWRVYRECEDLSNRDVR